jgi:Na+/H+ antiporter NhaD/arsenite permease-like protein
VVSLLPAGGSLPDLILVALVAALAANLLNNLPATLILAPVAAALGLGPDWGSPPCCLRCPWPLPPCGSA